jgi:hypothetical protein
MEFNNARRYATDHIMPPAVSEDEKGETKPSVFSPSLKTGFERLN